MSQPQQARTSPQGEGDTYWTGFSNIIRISGEDTNGAFAVIEMQVPPGYGGPPHIHHNEDETFYTVDGTLEYTVGDDTIVGDAGTIVHAPRDVPHAFRNPTDTEAIAHTWVHPAGFEEFMAEATPKVTDPTDPPELDMARVMEIAPDYGVEFLTPDADEP